MKHGRALAVIALAAALVRLGAACIIDLDPPGGALAEDAAADQGGDVFGPGLDAGDGAIPDVFDGATECKTDPDCVPSGFGAGCLSGRCDLGRCAYDLCPSGSACGIKRCDLDAGAGTCGAVEDPSFLAGAITVSTGVPLASLPCANASRCIAVSYPFVFVVDGQDSVTGYLVADPTASPPRAVAVDSLEVQAAALVASGRRVFFVGNPSGGKLTIGWFDVPGNPFASKIAVNRIEVSYAATSLAVPTLMPAPDESLFLVSGRETFLFTPPGPATKDVVLAKPLPDIGSAVLVAATGARIAGQIVNATTGTTQYTLLDKAGTKSVGFTPSVTTTNATRNVANGTNQWLTASNAATGAVVGAGGVGAIVEGGVPNTERARLAWIVAATGSAVVPDAGIDLATYAAPFDAAAGSPRAAAAPAPYDGGAVVVYLNPARNGCVARFVVRDDGTGAPALTDRQVALPGSTAAAYSLATSGDWVYAYSSTQDQLTIRLIRPACDTADGG